MSIRQWGWPQLLLFWLASLALAAGLLLLQAGRPGRLFWLLPYPSSMRLLGTMLITFFRELPFAGVALIVVPAVVALVTVY